MAEAVELAVTNFVSVLERRAHFELSKWEEVRAALSIELNRQKPNHSIIHNYQAKMLTHEIRLETMRDLAAQLKSDLDFAKAIAPISRRNVA